jgi:hypothetical protein
VETLAICFQLPSLDEAIISLQVKFKITPLFSKKKKKKIQDKNHENYEAEHKIISLKGLAM